jgi:hypothetical protein
MEETLVVKGVVVHWENDGRLSLGLISQVLLGKLVSMNRMQPNNPERRRDEIDMWKDLGVPAPQYDEDQSKAPPVDRDALRAHLNRENSEEEARRICELMVRFRSWAEAMGEIAAHSFRENYPKGPPFPGTED